MGEKVTWWLWEPPWSWWALQWRSWGGQWLWWALQWWSWALVLVGLGWGGAEVEVREMVARCLERLW